jgi:hypothetical protein
MVVAGNKFDLGRLLSIFFFYLNLLFSTEDERVVSKDQGQALARQFNCTFVEASAKYSANVPDVS